MFDEMWYIPRLYASACLIRVSWYHFILYHHIDSVSSLYKELKECISEVERIQEASRVTNNGSKKKGSFAIKEEEAPATTPV
jgi:hypothetical protein